MSVLLKTKLHIPPVRSEQLLRPRLFERLNASLGGKITLVSAPAGFGKTTLVSTWITLSGKPAAWFSLEKDDNDPERFWSYFTAAIQTTEPGIGEDFLTSLHASSPVPAEVCLSSLINEIESIQTRFVLVLDDFHVIDNRQIQESLLFLVDHQPTPMHVILSTRADPPWQLARLRAQGEVTEIRVDDLRFTQEETTAFLNSIMGFTLAPDEILALDTRTEGWVAGLQMSALSMQGRENKAEFISALTGSHRFILDYLVEEVLDLQTSDIQEFLLKTSILDRMTAPLCDAVVQRKGSQDVLVLLEKSNLFLTPLDDERRWFRYHHLFADLLRSNLQLRFFDQVHELHRRASRWYAEYGMLPEAVQHAFESDDIEAVAQIIEKNALTAVTVFNEQLPALVGWLDALPEDLLRSRPWLAVARAWVLAYSGELNAAEVVIQAAEQAISGVAVGKSVESISREHLAGYLAAIRGYWFFMNGDVPGAVEWMEKAGLQLPKDDAPTRVFSAVILGAAMGMMGNLATGIRLLSETAGLWQSAQEPLLTIMVLCELAGLQILKGQLNQVIMTCQQAFQLSNEYARSMGLQPPSLGFAYARFSYVLREQNDLEVAISNAQEAVKISRNWGQKDNLCMSYLYLALVLQAAGRADEASQMMNKARQVSRTLSPSVDAVTAAYEAKFHYRLGDIGFISSWSEESGISIQDELSFNRAREYLVYARALMAQGKLNDSLAFLERLQIMSEATGALSFEIEILILQALIMQIQGEVGRAMPALARALRLAEPVGYVRIFVDEGVEMEKLLRQAVRRGIAVQYIRKLLAVLEASARQAGERMPAEPVLLPAASGDSLTRREVEILQLLMTSQSVLEIADHLCIAPSTLRTHIRNIYDKLGVHSRMEAAAFARELTAGNS